MCLDLQHSLSFSLQTKFMTPGQASAALIFT
jgi:hypothetical protein